MENTQESRLFFWERVQGANQVVLIISSLVFIAVCLSVLRVPFWFGFTIFTVYALSGISHFVLKHEIRLMKIEARQEEAEKRLKELEKGK